MERWFKQGTVYEDSVIRRWGVAAGAEHQAGFLLYIEPEPPESTIYQVPVIDGGMEVEGAWFASYAMVDRAPADMRQQIIVACYMVAKSILNAAVGLYSAGEMAGWEGLENQAKVYDGGNGPIGDDLQNEATQSSVTVDVKTTAILEKASALRLLRTAVVAARDVHKATLMIEPDNQLKDYEYKEDWPSLTA